MKTMDKKLTVVERCAEQMAVLDAAGHGVIVMRCNQESEIRRIISKYAFLEKVKKSRYIFKDSPKEYTPTTSDRLKEVNALGMVRRVGEPFDWMKHGYKDKATHTDYTAANSLITELTNYTSFPQSMRHCLLYIPDARKLLGEAENATEIQKQYLELLEDLARKKKKKQTNALVVVACTDGVLHEDLKRFSYIMDVPYPDAEEIAALIEQYCRECNAAYCGMPRSVINALAEEMRGFREDDVFDVISMAYASEEDPLANNAKALFLAARDTKKQLIAGVTGLSWLDTDNSDIGGLYYLRDWLDDKRWSLNYPHVSSLQKVDAPKGVMLCGLPGSGKTTLAKFTARLLGRDNAPLPLLKMSITAFKSKYVGETTEKCEHALRTVESAAPCVLLVDEVEKIFGGMGSGSSHEVTSDMFSIILDWMQKKKDKPVFVIATANRSEEIPSEFKRKGRFDEVFFVGVPSAAECRDIFDVHLKRKKNVMHYDGKKWDDVVDDLSAAVLRTAAEQERFLSGVDIESLISAAFEKLFVKEMRKLRPDQLQSIEEADAPIAYYSDVQVKDELVRRLKNTRSYFDNNMAVTAEYWLDMYKQQFLEAGGMPAEDEDEDVPAESFERVILPSDKEAFSLETRRFSPEYLCSAGLLSADDDVPKFDENTKADEYKNWLERQLRAAHIAEDYDGVFRWRLAREIFTHIGRMR